MYATQQYTAQSLILGGAPLVIDGPPETSNFELHRAAAHTVAVVVAEPDTEDALSWNDWFCEHEQPFLLLAPGQNGTIVGTAGYPAAEPMPALPGAPAGAWRCPCSRRRHTTLFDSAHSTGAGASGYTAPAALACESGRLSAVHKQRWFHGDCRCVDSFCRLQRVSWASIPG
ncbi:MAG: hypothetical protein KatS3mg057_2603 [Herpetosiphonaceae bacterium]|nr:MAG: hypothetical protein KatS3mg057_2603 [Herpetosiphonaceae bacterium]